VPISTIIFRHFFRGFAVPDSQATDARTLPSPLRAILPEVILVLVYVALASFDFYVLQGVDLYLSVPSFALLLALNLVLLALMVVPFSGFERRRIAVAAETAPALLLTLLLSLMLAAPSFAAGERFALVIGNAKYRDIKTPLKEPINDARDVADELKHHGFNVDTGENLTAEQMRGAFERLYGKIKPGSVALIFFSGFGLQSGRQSYMIPVDAQIRTEADVRRDGFSLKTVLGEINSRGASVKIALIDASRRNPLERGFPGNSAGLAPVTVPRGTLVMYSAAPSSVSSDNGSDHSLFVQELLKEIRTPGLTAEQALDRARIGVTRASRGEQVPWISSSLAENFSFAPGDASPRPLSLPSVAVAAAPSAPPTAALSPAPRIEPGAAPAAKATAKAIGHTSDSERRRVSAAARTRKGAPRYIDDSGPPAGQSAAGLQHSARPTATSPPGTVDAPRKPPEFSTTSAPIPEPFNASAYWNSWFVDGTGPAANILIANNTYTFTLDVAAFDYAALRQKTQSSGTKVDKAFAALIADLSTPETILNIKPMIPEGSGLRLMDDKNFYPMKVDLRKLRQPNADAARQYAEGSMPIAEFSKQVSAGSIQITVTAESKGCATIAFAIFRGLLPLDHLVQRVSIGETGTSAPVCDSADPAHSNALSGGLDSLREVSLGMEGSGASATASAALHIFDFESYSMAVFVDGRPGKNQSVYGWQTAASVVDFLRHDHFQNMILKARKDSADKKPGSYVPAAQELSKVLFSTKPGNSTETDAKNALAAFRAVVREAQGSPVIVVRVASDAAGGQNRSIYVPLGILGAKGQGAVLERPIIVVQPMALERYPSRDKCIGDWMFAVPEGLENVPGAVMPPGFFPANIPGRRISEIEKLREYLAAATGTAAPLLAAAPAAVGFVVLAHKDEGVMWFGESTNHIMPQDIEKKFPPGSVGIFAACSAASAKGRNAALLQRLNEQGIDTLIASPFTIDAGYGVVFASSFAEVIAEITSDKPRPTILELFDKTVSRTAQKFKDKTDGEYGELGLEYVLLGNPAIKLCTPP
jgi:uncharacterized caspase-like protein